jgi:hypothetical protein
LTRRRVAVGCLYLGLVLFFGGVWGLVVGATILGSYALFRFPTRTFWLAAVAFMGMTPFAIVAQGLPNAGIAGPDFGTRHMVAHVFVGISLALVAWAAMNELVEERATTTAAHRDAREAERAKRDPSRRWIGGEGPDLPSTLNE